MTNLEGATWTHHYSPVSGVRRPMALLRDVARSAWLGRSLAFRLFLRNLTGSHRQTFLGFGWILVPTILLVATWWFLAQRRVVAAASTSTPEFLLFLAYGTVIWQTFFAAVQAPLNAVSQNKTLVTRINIPREALVMVAFTEVVFEMLVRLIIVSALGFMLGASWTPATMLAPVMILCLIMVGLAIGLLLTPMGILYQDVGRALTMISPLWMMVTPVLYRAPQNGFQTWNMINPPAALLEASRTLLTDGSIDVTSPLMFWGCAAAPMFIVGLIWYRVGFPIFVERLAN